MPESGVALGFDFGLARIGVAVGAPGLGTARGLAVVANRAGRIDWPAIDRLIGAWAPAVLVLGEPQTRRDPRMLAALRRFRAELERRYALPVAVVDEDDTTACARAEWRQRRRAGARKRAARGDLDMLSAALILRTWLA